MVRNDREHRTTSELQSQNLHRSSPECY